MINLFSLEIFIGLIAGIFIGWVLKNIFSKKENVGDLASNLKSLEDKIDGFQTSNATERGSIKTILQDIKTKKKKIKKMKPEYDQYSTLFHSRAEVEGLYQTLSEYAAMNNLVIAKIEKKEIKEVTQAAALALATGKKQKKKKKKKKAKKTATAIAYYTIPVQFQIDGSFLGYIKFKRQLSLSQKMLNFDKESIKVVKGKDSTGAISVTGTLTIVGLADDF